MADWEEAEGVREVDDASLRENRLATIESASASCSVIWDRERMRVNG